MRSLLLSIAVAAFGALPSALIAATPATKAQVGQYAERLLADNYAQDGPGAAVIIARGDEVLFREARGMADVENGVPLSADALFEIASITKQFAAAGLLKLVEAGKVSLDDPLSKFVKDYPGGSGITVLELLNHTSGVKNYTDDGFIDAAAGKDMTTSTLIDRFKHEKPDFAPGKAWSYDNSGYALAGAVIEAASGLPWHVYLQRSLLQPLGLTHTGYTGDSAIAARQVRGYAPTGGKPRPAQRVSLIAADGALVSNVDDLLTWNRALHEGRVLKDDSYRKMITPVGAAVPEQYGLGLWHTTLRNHAMIGHSGHVAGFSAYLLYMPDSHTSVAILQNIERSKGVVDPTKSARQLAAFTIGEPYTAPKSIAVDDAALRQVAGVYGADLPGSRELTTQGARVLCVIGDKLTMARTGGDRSQLIPIARDVFQSADSFDRIHIERAASGQITAVRFFSWGEGDGIQLARSIDRSPVAVRIAPSLHSLERLVGTYAAEGMSVQILLDGNQLKALPSGQAPVTLFAESRDKFLVAEVEATMEFSPTEGMPQLATLHQGSETVAFKRKP